jgi:hypothetical protein
MVHVAPPAAASGTSGPPVVAAPRVLIEDVQGAWPIEGAVLVVRGAGRARRVARLEGDALVDEPLLSCGLPASDPPCATTSGGALTTEVTALGGRWPSMLLLGLSCAGGFGHTRLFAFTGTCWSENTGWEGGSGMLVARPEWQGGRGFLFGIMNLVEGGRDYPGFLLDPIPARPPDLMRAATPMPTAPERSETHTWVSADGSRVTLPIAYGPTRFVVAGREPPRAPRQELGPPLYVLADGTVVATTRADAALQVVLCDSTTCKTVAVPVAPSAFRQIGGRLYAFTAEAGFRVLRLDGARWVDVPTGGFKATAVAPVGDSTGGSLLLLVEQDGRRSLARWTP